MEGLILSLDIGTSSTRAALYDTATCEALPNIVFSIHHEPDRSEDGGVFLDPDRIVEEAVSCAEFVLARRGGRPVLGVALCTFWHSTVGIGSDGVPVTPILVWSETRSAPQVIRLKREKDVSAYVQRVGCPLHTSFLPGRLLHLAETQPDVFARCVRFVSPGEYLFHRLFGSDRVTCSVSMASATGLLDQARGEWDQETLSWIPGMSVERLSPIGDAPVQGLLSPWKERLPDVADVPWFPALGDGACSNVGCGATSANRLALMIGTSGAMRVAVAGSEPPEVPQGLWRYQLAPGRFLLGGALTNGGAVWSWLKETVQMPSGAPDEISREIDRLPPDGHGMTVLPFLSGERAPLWRDDLRAMLHGLSGTTTPLEIVRAHLEAVALRFVALRRALDPVAPVAEIIGTGAGLLASPAWARILADALGEPLQLSAERQASSRGAALMVRERLGIGSVVEAPLPATTRTLEPNPLHTALYANALERQNRLLRLLLDFNG